MNILRTLIVTFVLVSCCYAQNPTAEVTGRVTDPNLPPGEYRVSVRLQGFRGSDRTVPLVVDQVARLNVKLEVGNVNETIEVTGSARNYLALAKLSMGVSEPSGAGQAGTAGDRTKSGGAFVANGARSANTGDPRPNRIGNGNLPSDQRSPITGSISLLLRQRSCISTGMRGA